MSGETIRINFGRPIPIFPLGAVLLVPHTRLPLHIFEGRYRQMIGDALDASGLIAMAVLDQQAASKQRTPAATSDEDEFDLSGEVTGVSSILASSSQPDEPDEATEFVAGLPHFGKPASSASKPPVRPVVCIGHIGRHEKLSDGRYNVELSGVCRARIRHEAPGEKGKLYRTAYLEPMDLEEIDEEDLAEFREHAASLLAAGALSDLRVAPNLLQLLADDDVPTSVIVDVLGVALVEGTDRRYSLLATDNAPARAELVEAELDELANLLGRARKQHELSLRADEEPRPKGVHWN